MAVAGRASARVRLLNAVSVLDLSAPEVLLLRARMAGLLLSQETVDTVLHLITTLAVEAVPKAAGAGVTLVSGRGERASAAATDTFVERADALQYELR